jgi:hypothetical protein
MSRRLRVRFADDIDAGHLEVWDRNFETIDPGRPIPGRGDLQINRQQHP